ncbi:hypothetical protein ACE1B6_04295 [Aerosakkonemataceae cyanobacterium BLCC-F154]|uniref:Ribosomal protein S18 n=1 Tax=Floridaenema fluviatile BLCC-F154 TaxID=3153640 RepID=A0ABV4Y6P6_9CYAN
MRLREAQRQRRSQSLFSDVRSPKMKKRSHFVFSQVRSHPNI